MVNSGVRVDWLNQLECSRLSPADPARSQAAGRPWPGAGSHNNKQLGCLCGPGQPENANGRDRAHGHFQVHSACQCQCVAVTGESTGARRRPSGSAAESLSSRADTVRFPGRVTSLEGRRAGSLTYCCLLASAPKKRRPVQVGPLRWCPAGP